jgi:hypothetical protein
MIDDDPAPDSMRNRVLMRDKQRCLLCSATAKVGKSQSEVAEVFRVHRSTFCRLVSERGVHR